MNLAHKELYSLTFWSVIPAGFLAIIIQICKVASCSCYSWKARSAHYLTLPSIFLFKGDILYSFSTSKHRSLGSNEMSVTYFGENTTRIQHHSTFPSLSKQPCSEQPVWVPVVINDNEPLPTTPPSSTGCANASTASRYNGNCWAWTLGGTWLAIQPDDV